MNKQYIKIIITVLTLINLKSSIYGISDNFKFVIDTIGIPRYNVNFEEINEDIYYTYNVFVYASPERLIGNKMQRFKTVLNQGKWTRYNGKYSGVGDRGEYYLLGKDYSGFDISNVYFPVDAAPETSPDNWNYIVTNGAYNSWNNINKYKHIEQLEYMKNTNILFDEIDYINHTTNPYNLIEYNINASKIGFDKATLEASSTWKTRGVITIRRILKSGKIRTAIFNTNPMAAEADVKSKLNVLDKYVLNDKEDNKTIDINFGSNVINLNYYANKNHIKQLVTTIYINDKEIGKISGNKTINVDKSISFIVSRNDYKIAKTYPLKITVKSYLYTEFSTDGLMQDEITKIVNLEVKEKEVIPINKINVAVLEKDNQKLVVRPLVQTINTKDNNSEGIIEAGKYLAIKLNKNIDKLDIKVILNDKKINHEMIITDEKVDILKIKLDKNIENTVKSWNFLRNESNNYFNINFDDIGKRVKSPNILKLIINNKKEIIKFDTIDNYTNNINFCFNNNVINQNKINKKINIENWTKNEI
ncbi:MAG: hypothetical protein RR144_01295 [Clostridia bacterium]